MKYFNLIILPLFLQSPQVLAGDIAKVLIIDTGVDTSDPTLSQMFCPTSDSLDTTRPPRRPKVGPISPYNIPPDEIGHGTHVAGIIRALGGDSGYCLAFCKYYIPSKNNLPNTIKCLKHAKAIGAQFINYSSGGGSSDEREKAALAALEGWVAVAAGNDGADIDKPPYYPAAYHLPNINIIGSYDSNCNRAPTSNYGAKVAFTLGKDVYSSLPDGCRGFLSGTSMATAIATGASLRSYLGLAPIDTCQGLWDFLKAFWSKH